MQIEDKQNASPVAPVHSKPMRKPRPTTVYKRTIRAVRKAAELVGGIEGCEEAQGQLERFADRLLLTLEEMKAAKKAGKRKGKAAPTTTPEQMEGTQTT